MIKQVLFALVIACLLTVPAAARTTAQDSGWQVTIFDPDTATIMYITANGLEIGPSFPQFLNYGQINNARMSPDGHWLAVSVSTTQPNSPESMQIFVADVWNNTCCTEIVDPLNSGLTIRLLGPFSPSSSALVIAAAAFPTGTDARPPINLIQAFEVQTGVLINSIATSDLGQGGMVAIFGDWLEDGLRLAPSCWGCEPPYEGTYSIWNVFLGGLAPSDERFNLFADFLPATGEGIDAIQNTSYPESGVPGGIFAPSNVVAYYPTMSDPSQVIYANPTNHYVDDANWVVDGSAALVRLGGPLEFDQASGMAFPNGDVEAYVLFRSGSTIPVPDEAANILLGTPEGWIGYEPETRTVLNNRLTSENTIETTVLADQLVPIVIQTSYTLGAGAQGIFPIVPPPQPITCPGFMPSRLAVNSVARVTPGDPNNLRDQPNTSAALVGQIPGGDVFIVLEGPTCAGDSAWWRVNWQGFIGWTVEGQDQTYWLEPIPSGGF